MRFFQLSAVGLMLLSACSSQRMASNGSCEGLGLQPGTSTYDQCVEETQLRTLASDRMLFKTNNNKPLMMLSQQSTKPMSPLVNCTSYTVPLSTQPTLCD